MFFVVFFFRIFRVCTVAKMPGKKKKKRYEYDNSSRDLRIAPSFAVLVYLTLKAPVQNLLFLYFFFFFFFLENKGLYFMWVFC